MAVRLTNVLICTPNQGQTNRTKPMLATFAPAKCRWTIDNIERYFASR